MFCDKNHPFRTLQGDVRQICDPLFKEIGLNYFFHGKVYNDGSLSYLTNQHNWMDYVYSKEFQFKPPFPENENLIPGKFYLALSETIIPSNVLHDAASLFNLHHFLNITSLHDGYIEIFVLGIPHGLKHGINNYFIHLEKILNFCRQFRDSSKPLIDLSSSHKIKIAEPMRPTELSILSDLSTCLRFTGNHGVAALTMKEFDILQLTTLGLSAMEISEKTKRSARTVETQLQSLKNKLGCNKKSELIRIAIENGLGNF